MTRRRWALLFAFHLVFFVPFCQVLALRWVDPPLTLTMVGQVMAWEESKGEWRWVEHESVEIEELPWYVPAAAVASEDQRFFEHTGFDAEGIRKAIAHNRDRRPGEARHGGSTISQQVARNVFLWQGGGWFRKGLEAWYTLWIELLLPKERILEVYLGVAETGIMTFGVQAGAERYFHKPATALSKDEAARLIALLPSPRRWSVNGKVARRRSAFILQSMRPLPD